MSGKLILDAAGVSLPLAAPTSSASAAAESPKLSKCKTLQNAVSAIPSRVAAFDKSAQEAVSCFGRETITKFWENLPKNLEIGFSRVTSGLGEVNEEDNTRSFIEFSRILAPAAIADRLSYIPLQLMNFIDGLCFKRGGLGLDFLARFLRADGITHAGMSIVRAIFLLACLIVRAVTFGVIAAGLYIAATPFIIVFGFLVGCYKIVKAAQRYFGNHELLEQLSMIAAQQQGFDADHMAVIAQFAESGQKRLRAKLDAEIAQAEKEEHAAQLKAEKAEQAAKQKAEQANQPGIGARVSEFFSGLFASKKDAPKASLSIVDMQDVPSRPHLLELPADSGTGTGVLPPGSGDRESKRSGPQIGDVGVI